MRNYIVCQITKSVTIHSVFPMHINAQILNGSALPLFTIVALNVVHRIRTMQPGYRRNLTLPDIITL